MEVVHVASDPELVLCLVSGTVVEVVALVAVVVVEVKLRLSRSSARSSTHCCMVVERWSRPFEGKGGGCVDENRKRE